MIVLYSKLYSEHTPFDCESFTIEGTFLCTNNNLQTQGFYLDIEHTLNIYRQNIWSECHILVTV